MADGNDPVRAPVLPVGPVADRAAGDLSRRPPAEGPGRHVQQDQQGPTVLVRTHPRRRAGSAYPVAGA